MVQEMEQKIALLQKQLDELKKINSTDGKLIKEIEDSLEEYKKLTYEKLDAWGKVLLARHPKRPTSLDYLDNIFDDFIELHGDRLFSDDKSIVGGIGIINNMPVTVITQQKGRNTQENIGRNFGMPHPEGYRKALRLMKQADKFDRPIITFIDTPGAFPGIGAEERGQGEAIARNLMEMMNLNVPVIAIVISEGGSGGALALGVANKVFMLENAVYSILSPEGFASILWKDAAKAKEAAEIMKLTANDLYDMKVIDGIIEEPIGGAHLDLEHTSSKIKEVIIQSLSELCKYNTEEILTHRYDRFRSLGDYKEIER